MDMISVKDYIMAQSEVEAPELQKRFSLSYAEIKSLLGVLLNNGLIEYSSGVAYKVVKSEQESKHAPSIYTPKNETESLALKSLWEFIDSNTVSTSSIQRRFGVGYATAAMAIEWLEDNDLIGHAPYRDVKLGRNEYCERFGNPEAQSGESNEKSEERENELNKHRMDVIDYINNMGASGALKADDGEDNDDIDIIDVDDCDENAGDEALDEHMRRMMADSDEEQKENCENEPPLSETHKVIKPVVFLKRMLLDCFQMGLKSVTDEQACILNSENIPEFEFELVHNECDLRISDCGKTLAQCSQTRRKIKNVLKGFAPVTLDGDEITITVESPPDTLCALLKLYAAVDAVKKMK